MSQKKTYIYRMLIGNNNILPEVDIFMYARNAETAKTYCKNIYKDKKYDSYTAIKVGLSRTLQDTQIMQQYEADQLRNSIASKSDKYSEREIEAPQFITKEEAGELGL